MLIWKILSKKNYYGRRALLAIIIFFDTLYF